MSRDMHLKNAVLDELAWEPSVDAAHVGVAAEHGVVTLSGHVGSLAEKYAAEAAATRVKGVKGVVVEIDVRLAHGSAPSDQDIAAAAVERLSTDTRVPRGTVKAEVERGWITLVGELDWYYQKAAAEQDVENLAGVVGVSNRITIRPKVDVENIGDDIMHALHRSWFFDPQTITVSAEEGRVRLTGSVRSLHERQVAAATAWAAPGVTDVRNELVVE